MDSQLFKIIKEDFLGMYRIVREIEDLNIMGFQVETVFLKSLLKDMREKIEPPYTLENTFKVMQMNSIIDFEAEVLENKILLLNQTQSIKTAINYLSNKLRSWVKSFGARLWQIICNLLTPYEWSIQGGVGNQSLLGLGNAQVKIKFGDNKNSNS